MNTQEPTPPFSHDHPHFLPQPAPPGKVVRRLMRLVDWNEHEYTCDAVFELLDEYAEMTARGEDVSRLMPLLKRHLEMCPSCEDEHEALLNILKNHKE